MAISQTVTNVIKDVLGDVEIQDNAIILSGDNKQSCLDRGDFRPWYNDKFNLSCSNIAERSQKINERFTKYTSADILACIKFESARQETNSTRQNSKWGRRLQFSTGASVSLDNLIQCGSDHQFQDCEPDHNRSATDCKLFPEDPIIRVTPSKHLPGTDHVHTSQPRASACPWQNKSVRHYDSPFDPRLSFHGLADLVLQNSTDTAKPEVYVTSSVPETFNCLIESDCPTEFTNSYLQSYRNFLQSLVNDTQCRESSNSMLPDASDNDNRANNDLVPDFVGESKETRELWNRVKGTRQLWQTDNNDGLNASDEEGDQDVGTIRGSAMDQKAAEASLDNAFPRMHSFGARQISPHAGRSITKASNRQDCNNLSHVPTVTISARPPNRNPEMTVKGDEEQNGPGDEKLKTLPHLSDVSDHVTQTPVNHSLAEGEVNVFGRAPLDNHHDESRPTAPKPDTRNETDTSNQRSDVQRNNTRAGDLIGPRGGQRPPVGLLNTPTETCRMTKQTSSASDINTDPTRQTVQGVPVLNSIPNPTAVAEITRFPHHSSVFWTHNLQGHHRPHQQNQLPEQAFTSNNLCIHHQQQLSQRQDQRMPQQHQQNHNLYQQHVRHSGPVLVQNQYGTYVNQTQQHHPGHYKQFMTPTSLYKSQVPVNQVRPSVHAQETVQYNTYPLKNTRNGRKGQYDQYRSRQMAVDDEVWYINGVPHYNTRPVNQYEVVTSRGYGRQEMPSLQPRPWSINGSTSDIRLVHPTYIVPPPTLPPPPPQAMFQPYPANLQAHWNANSHNAGPPPTVVYAANENYTRSNGDVPIYHLNQNTNNSNQSANRSCRSPDEDCRISPFGGILDEDDASVTEDKTSPKDDTKENQITVLGIKMRSEEEKTNKRKKNRAVRSGLVRIV